MADSEAADKFLKISGLHQIAGPAHPLLRLNATINLMQFF
jgi:hypothetical protein